jgi:hypothetical protein
MKSRQTMMNDAPLTITGSASTEERVSSRPTRFSLAANYDPDLIPQLASYPVDEVYGKFPTDGISGGRPRYLATPLTETDLRSYIRLLEQHRTAFNSLRCLPVCPSRQIRFHDGSGILRWLDRMRFYQAGRNSVRLWCNLLQSVLSGVKPHGTSAALRIV